MDGEYTVGALTRALSISKKHKKKKHAEKEKMPLEDLFATPPLTVTFVPYQQTKSEKKKRMSSTPAEPEKEAGKKLRKRRKRTEDEAEGSSDEEAVQVSRKKKLQKASRDPNEEGRTVFVGNLPNSVNLKKLEKLFGKYGKVETVRIRSVAVADPEMPRKLAVIRRDFHPERKNMNAYVRFEAEEGAKAALALNGQTYKGFCLRVDLATRQKQHDHKKSIFLGNLPFSIEENIIHSHFDDCGEIEGVRVVRDSRTGVGKGFGYIQFKKSESVELALKLDGSQLVGRQIRVSRSKPNARKASVADGKSSQPQHHRQMEETLPAGADRKSRMAYFSRLKKTNKAVPQSALQRNAARRISKGKKNKRKITDGNN